MQLILGTAGFCQPYGEGVSNCPSLHEVIQILRLAKEANIEWIDTAVAYGCEDYLKLYAKNFHIINKAREFQLWGNALLYHYKPGEEPKTNLMGFTGVSVYDKEQITGEEDFIQLPFHLENNKFIDYLQLKRPKIIVRNVLNRGQLLTKYTLKECYQYVKSFNRVWGILIGPNSVKELEQILTAW